MASRHPVTASSIQGSVTSLRDAIRIDMEVTEAGGVPTLSSGQVGRILADPEFRAIMGIAACAHPNVPAAWVIESITSVTADPHDQATCDLLRVCAENRWLDADALRAICAWSETRDGWADDALADNPACPPDVLLTIAHRIPIDEINDPEADLATDPSQLLLRVLAIEPGSHIVDVLMRNPNVTPDVIETVAARAHAAGKAFDSVNDMLADLRAHRILSD